MADTVRRFWGGTLVLLVALLLVPMPVAAVPTPAAADQSLWMTDGPVYATAQAGNTLYIGGNFAGGSFTTIGGENRNSLAALDVASGQATPWNPDVDKAVYALSLTSGTLYAGGPFTTVGGQARNGLAAFAADGQLDPWNPGAVVPASAAPVQALLATGDAVYVGGGFSAVAGTPIVGVAALGGVARPASFGGTAPPATVGTPYRLALGATGFPAPQVALGAGTLPPGVVFDSASGVLSGTPTAAGSYRFTVTATNGVGAAAS